MMTGNDGDANVLADGEVIFYLPQEGTKYAKGEIQKGNLFTDRARVDWRSSANSSF
jgi:hypothetical protein